MPHGSSAGMMTLSGSSLAEFGGREPAPTPASSRAPGSSAPSPGSPGAARRFESGIGDLVLGLRLLALAVVAGSGTLLPISTFSRTQLVWGILAGAGLGLAQYVAVRFGRRAVGEALILAQVATWTWLVHISGDQDSPLFVGYLLEVALAGAAFFRRGCALAALGGFAAYVLVALHYGRPVHGSTVATVGGFLAVGTVLTWLLIEAIERQRRRLEIYHQALHERADTVAEELRLLGDYLSGALIGLDGLGRVASVNPACAQLLGVDRARITGRPWQELIRADEDGVRAIVATLSEGTPQRGLTMALKRADGPEVVVEAELWVSPSPEGRRTYLLLREATGVAQSADPLRRLGEAVACVAHQIKNSLHALHGLASEIASDTASAPDRENVEHLLKVVKSLNALSEDVLAMAGSSRPPAEDVSVCDVLASAAALTRLTLGRIAVDAPEKNIVVRAHRGQLVHACFNLLDNASRVTPPDTPVGVGVRRVGESVTIEITDRGPGMPATVASSDGPVASSRGSGFGLLAVRRFIEGNGGTLTFEPRPGGGTLCRLVFPVAPSRMPAGIEA